MFVFRRGVVGRFCWGLVEKFFFWRFMVLDGVFWFFLESSWFWIWDFG